MIAQRPEPLNIEDVVGDSFSLTVQYENIDVEGSTWRATVRESTAEGAGVWAEMDVDGSHSASPESMVVLTIPASKTQTAIPGHRYAYDVERTDANGVVFTEPWGWLCWNRDMTRP